MNSKWYLSALFFVLALLGVSLKQTSSPNQEILVQFNYDGVTFDEAQNAIAIVKEQLEGIGVEHIQVKDSGNGKLKITYYSEVDVALIKELFSQEGRIAIGYTSYGDNEEDSDFPSQNYSNSYKVNVSEIQGSSDFVSDYEGLVLETKSVTTRYIHPDVYLSTNEVNVQARDRIEKVAFEVHKYNALFIDNSSHNIPEVRAGPSIVGKS